MALKVLGDHELARDAFQSAFISITQNWKKINLSSDPEKEKETKNYIATITYHAALKLSLKVQKIKRIEVPFPKEKSNDDENIRWDNKNVRPLSVASFEDMVIEDIDREKLFEAIKELKPEHSMYIVDYFYKDMSMRQIADKYGISEDAAKKRVYRSIKKLREQFFKKGVK
ncbi:MAG: sigma-70 family RNA polymerase sigma factor [Lachnospiraceae bacterium]|nr:sigma-70 family RNA polymerase sigma factor [Lachnospiraceae bacterium]